jgi:endonuclease/exonuclease/phosphatase (EEP) superfamily protein YafD
MLNKLLVIAIIGGVLPLGAGASWVLELSSHFRLQYVALALPLIAAALIRRRRLLGALLVITTGLNAWPLLPYLPTRDAAAPGTAFTVLDVNVNARNQAHDRVLESIRRSDADFVTLIELSRPLAAKLAALDSIYPFRMEFPADGNFGLAVLSRHPLTEVESVSIGPTVALHVIVELGDRRFHLVAVHPLPPIRSDMAATRNAQLEELAAYVRAIDAPTVVCGDFNLSPYSPYSPRFEAASATLSARRGRGIGISWPTFMPVLGMPIDHCFVTEDFASTRVVRMARIGSDHYPVRFELQLNRER